MSYLLNKYGDWLWGLSDTTGDLISCVGYTAWCASLTGAMLTYEAAAFIPMYVCLGIAAIITTLVYIP